MNCLILSAVQISLSYLLVGGGGGREGRCYYLTMSGHNDSGHSHSHISVRTRTKES